MVRWAVLSCVIAGCTYRPGSFHHGAGPDSAFQGQRTTIGCLDIAIDRRADLEDQSAVLHYRFGNRCERPVEIALQQVAVVGRLADGTEVALAPFDPRLELHTLRIDGRFAGGEALAYPAPQRLVQVCANAATISPSHAGAGPHWLCFASPQVPDAPDAPDDPLGEPGEPATPVAEVTP